MSFVPSFDDVSPAIRSALETHGFTALTPVQEAVLDPALAGRDLRIFSQTGSGKTVAVGLAIAPDLERVVGEVAAEPAGKPGPAHPFALVVAPTRELAQQIARELGWLFSPLGAQVTVVTGGSSYVRELAALRRGPLVVVGTPGRLIDHLGRKAIDPSRVGVVVLDEADQMLDLGFRDELEAILEQMPEPRRTLLLSATFPREVQRLADRCQKDPIVAAAAGAGEKHADITHIAHIVLGEEREKALVNLLLMSPGERALVFVRTREGAAELADHLSDLGLPARAIHGDLEQRDRTRTLDAFRSGAVSTLVATDVAARGLDVPDVARVIHADPPGDAEVLTHRSGRTGRAGKKGTSIVLVPPGMRERVRFMLRRAGVEPTWAPAPSAADVHRAADERLAAELMESDAPAPDARLMALAERLLATQDPQKIVATLLARAERTGACEPADVTPILPPPPRTAQTSPPPPPRGARRPGPEGGRPSGGYDGPPNRRGADDGQAGPGFVAFRVNWGTRQGADPRRLLALVCRRGGIRGSDVGAIRIGFAHSTFEVAGHAAEEFARAAKEPDARDPKIHIAHAEGPPAGGAAGGPPRPVGPGGPEGGRPHAPGPRSAAPPRPRIHETPAGEVTGPRREKPERASAPATKKPLAKGYGPPKRRPRSD